MDELVQWLREQLDDDEQTAQAASAGPWSTRWNGQDHELVAPARAYPIAEWTYAIATQEPEASAHRAECDTANADHIVRHDPARVLREIDAKRKTIALCEPPLVDVTGPGDTEKSFVPGEGTPWGLDVLKLLALPYADRPGYREAWRP
ncbi:hypothetical protein GCM10010330_11080 [Streptomyces tendae]|uniref:DUF6221 family protein n=1 Tax=Streptomyces tendae TaxID=1932 RepID=UPI001672E4A3|nr:DUF6221 family protein [Streptomyces tendae]GHA61028.1 hypothetical protein GCM10010330_11080 [Streptomyces tendae]